MEIDFGRVYTEEEVQGISAKYAHMSDEELLDIVRSATKVLGRVPKKTEIPAFWSIKQRLGPWPRVLVKAGVKEPSAHYIHLKDGRRRKKGPSARKQTQNA